MDKPHITWRGRMVPIKGPLRIEPPEPVRVPPTSAPGWIAFAYRIGIEPRTAEAREHWRGRMIAVSRGKS